MDLIIESLWRLYHAGTIKKEKIDALLANKKITKEEYEFILTDKAC